MRRILTILLLGLLPQAAATQQAPAPAVASMEGTVVRFGTGDLSKLDIEYCPCGRTAVRLTKILGRVGDAVRVRGMFIHLKQSEQVIKAFPEITGFQIVVTRPAYRDYLKLKVQLREEPVDSEKLKQPLSERFRDVCRLSPDEIVFLGPDGLANETKVIIDEREY